uniref:SDR family NAD(P)-dependent oxidoreductase n=1 Tax=Listeria monocytogenes TaxID=1639 RepID=UPI000A91E401
LITGATGGIGRAFTTELHRRGYQLIITGRSTEKLTELSQSVTGGAAQIVAADLGTQEGIDTLGDGIRSNPLDILVNNAGFGTHGSFAELDFHREL